MLTDEGLLGVRRADMGEMKALKLQLPLRHVLLLHKMRIVANQGVSEIVAQALNDYFEDMRRGRAAEVAVAQ